MITLLNPLRFNSPLETGIQLPVINPGGETGDMTGWSTPGTNYTNTALRVPGDYPGPRNGARYFWAGNVATAIMRQDVDVSAYATEIDAATLRARLRAWQAGYDGTDTRLTRLFALDAANNVLSEFTPRRNSGNLTWVATEITLGLPPTTRKVRMQFEGYRSGPTSNDNHVDDIRLALIPMTTYTTYAQTISTGNRAASITVTATNITAGAGTPAGLVDGSQANNYWWNAGTGNGTQWLLFDFGAGNAWKIDEFRWYQDNDSTHGVWRLEGSPDNAAWTQIGSDFTLGHGMIRPGNNDTAYRYYRLRHMSGGRVTAPWLREIEFKAAL